MEETMSEEWGRMDNYLPHGGVGVRTSTSGITLIHTYQKRRWWWPWKLKRVTEVLAHSYEFPEKGDVVNLSQVPSVIGHRFIVTIARNDMKNIVINWLDRNGRMK
jgi:hypothetical protein